MLSVSKSAFRAIAASIMVACVAACSTAYQPTGLSGGFEDTRLAPDVFRITFRGNSFTSNSQVQDYALLRAAELCLASGFSHFVLLDVADQSHSVGYVTPGTATTSGTLTGAGSSATYQGRTTYTPPTVTSFYKPGVGLVVKGLPGEPVGSFAFDAAFLIQTVKTKYQIP